MDEQEKWLSTIVFEGMSPRSAAIKEEILKGYTNITAGGLITPGARMFIEIADLDPTAEEIELITAAEKVSDHVLVVQENPTSIWPRLTGLGKVCLTYSLAVSKVGTIGDVTPGRPRNSSRALTLEQACELFR